jgi:hypothetical protein
MLVGETHTFIEDQTVKFLQALLGSLHVQRQKISRRCVYGRGKSGLGADAAAESE